DPIARRSQKASDRFPERVIIIDEMHGSGHLASPPSSDASGGATQKTRRPLAAPQPRSGELRHEPASVDLGHTPALAFIEQARDRERLYQDDSHGGQGLPPIFLPDCRAVKAGSRRFGGFRPSNDRTPPGHSRHRRRAQSGSNRAPQRALRRSSRPDLRNP